MQARAFFVLLGIFLAGGVFAADLERILRSPFVTTGTQPGETVVGKQGAFSADGRYFVFASSASAVVPGVLDLNGTLDVFVQDLQLGTLRLITHAAGLPNLTAGGRSERQRISGDGSVVVFASSAKDLAPIVTPYATAFDIYWHDLASGVTRPICHSPGQPEISLSCSSFTFPVSADGRYVLVEALDPVSQFIPGAVDANTEDDLLIWDSVSDTFELVSHVPGNPLQTTPSRIFTDALEYSADGRYVAYLTRNPWLVSGDSGQSNDVVLYDRQTRSHQLVSHAIGAPDTPADDDSWAICGLSPDGRYLLFESNGTNLVAGFSDLNSTSDLFLFDRVAGTNELISRRPPPAPATGNSASRCGWFSDDARYVYFNSWASNLVTGVTDGNSPDLFLRDRQAGVTRLVTRRWSSPQQAAGGSMEKVAAVSADGKTLIFNDSVDTLVDATHYGRSPWSFRYDPDLDRIEVALEAAIPPGSTVESRVAAMSRDAVTSVFLTPFAAFLTGLPGPERDYPPAVAHRTTDGEISLIGPAAYSGMGRSSYGMGLDAAAVTGDGSRVIFPNGGSEICDTTIYALCLYDRAEGTYENVNHHPANPQLGIPLNMLLLDLSEPDGRFLLVQSASPVFAQSDTNGAQDILLYDTQNGAFELISRRQGTTGTTANGRTDMSAYKSIMTPDAGQVVFTSEATDLVAGQVDTALSIDLFLRDRASGQVALISHRPGQPLAAANSTSQYPAIAAMGQFVVFESYATDLVSGFVNGNGSSGDIYLYSAPTGAVTLVSHAAGLPSQGGNSFVGSYFISANGRFIAYNASSTNLAAGVTDANGTGDAFLFDRATGESTLLSHAAGQPLVAANGNSNVQDMSSDGRYLLIRSSAADLMPGLVDFEEGLFLLDRDTGSLRLVSERPGQPGASVEVGWGWLGTGAERVYFSSASVDVFPGTVDGNRKPDIFVWERSTGRLELLTARYGSSATTANAECYLAGPNALLDDNQGVLLKCSASDLLPHGHSGTDLLLATFPQALFADGFESGDTTAW